MPLGLGPIPVAVWAVDEGEIGLLAGLGMWLGVVGAERKSEEGGREEGQGGREGYEHKTYLYQSNDIKSLFFSKNGAV